MERGQPIGSPVAAEHPVSAPAVAAAPASHPITFGDVWVGIIQPTASALAAARARPESGLEKPRNE